MKQDTFDKIFLAIINKIKTAYPSLEVNINKNDANVDINVDIKQQTGLAFNINLNLQSDELHLCVGNYWLQWFPCTDSKLSDLYYEVIHGLIDGSYRILESYRGNKCYQAVLEKKSGDNWEAIDKHGVITWPFPRKVQTNIIQNV